MKRDIQRQEEKRLRDAALHRELKLKEYKAERERKSELTLKDYRAEHERKHHEEALRQNEALQRELKLKKGPPQQEEAQLQKETAITHPFQRTMQTETMKRELKHREEELLRHELGLNSTNTSTMMRAVEILEPRGPRAYFTAFLVNIHESGQKPLVRYFNEKEPTWVKAARVRARPVPRSPQEMMRTTLQRAPLLKCFSMRSKRAGCREKCALKRANSSSLLFLKRVIQRQSK
jgi:hypothetical protein